VRAGMNQGIMVEENGGAPGREVIRPLFHFSRLFSLFQRGSDFRPHRLICNNNNTFTWSGPSGVLGCTGQRP
jgi:hypothetical protein